MASLDGQGNVAGDRYANSRGTGAPQLQRGAKNRLSSCSSEVSHRAESKTAPCTAPASLQVARRVGCGPSRSGSSGCKLTQGARAWMGVRRRRANQARVHSDEAIKPGRWWLLLTDATCPGYGCHGSLCASSASSQALLKGEPYDSDDPEAVSRARYPSILPVDSAWITVALGALLFLLLATAVALYLERRRESAT